MGAGVVTRGPSPLADMLRKGIPRAAARALRGEAEVLDMLVRSSRLTPAAARLQMARLAKRLATGPR